MTIAASARRAFTLIELLVVIILIFILAALAVAFLPSIGDQARAARAATMLQQWILTARQKALRDQVPCGIRLLPYIDPSINQPLYYVNKGDGTQRPSQVRQCQFIQQPDDFTINRAGTNLTGSNFGLLATPNPPPNAPPGVVFIYSSIPGGGVLQLSQQVAAGDYLEILGNGLMYQIVSPPGTPQINKSISATDAVTPLLLSSLPRYAVANTLINTGNTPPVPGTRQWRILRAPRVTGDDILQLPEGVIIDLKSNVTYGNPLQPTNAVGAGKNISATSFAPIDILFSPSGAVITPGFNGDTINLWVREYNYNNPPNPAPRSNPPQPDPDDADPFHGGEQSIIAISVRSGHTSAQPPAPSVSYPYTFIVDGRTSGQ